MGSVEPPAIFPFDSPNLEQEFIEDFHRRRLWPDRIMTGMVVCQKWMMREMLGGAAIGAVTSAIYIGVCLLTFMPGYHKGRGYWVYVFKLMGCIHPFYKMWENFMMREAPTFLSAAILSGFVAVRIMVPFFVAVTFQAPVRGNKLFLTGFTFLVRYLIFTGPKECQMQLSNPDIEKFSKQWQGVCEMYYESGSVAACSHMCENVIEEQGNWFSCKRLCPWVLPKATYLYCSSWVDTCTRHRMFMACAVYVVSVTAVYLLEGWERWRFAKARGLHVPSRRKSMLDVLLLLVQDACGAIAFVLVLTIDKDSLQSKRWF